MERKRWVIILHSKLLNGSENIGNDQWKYGNDHWIPEEVGYYYFGGLSNLTYGFDFCRPFIMFNQLEHAILFKLSW
jgi:hypothetical protein